MEMHEKEKRIQEQEMKLRADKEQKDSMLMQRKNKKDFLAKPVPNFIALQEKFNATLDKNKKNARLTVPKPFPSHYKSKKKAELCQYYDYENELKNKSRLTVNQYGAGSSGAYVDEHYDIKQTIKKMQKKPAIEPATTKGLTLMMDKRRQELEDRKKQEELDKISDMKRKKKEEMFKERVSKSEYLDKKKSKKELTMEEQRRRLANKKKDKEEIEKYNENLSIMNQRVANRPLMFEQACIDEGKKRN